MAHKPKNAAPCAHFHPNSLSCYRQTGADCENCPHIITLGGRDFCGYCPGRTSPHQVVRGQMWLDADPGKRCISCARYTKGLSSAICEPCLVSKDLTYHTYDPWFSGNVQIIIKEEAIE